MYYDYKKEYGKFVAEFEKQRQLMLEAGMSEDDINEMFAFDKRVFNRNRSFVTWQAELIETNEEKEKTKSTPKEFEENLSLLDKLDENIYQVVKNLSEKEQEILMLHYEKGLSLHEAALFLCVSYDTAKRRHSRAIQKLKNFS
jgi:DNA-directed RNA polymerase specialized sigma subunit, sigma24 homolog